MDNSKEKELEERIATVEDSLLAILAGCIRLVDTDTALSTRIDIVNKRLRKLEQKK